MRVHNLHMSHARCYPQRARHNPTATVLLVLASTLDLTTASTLSEQHHRCSHCTTVVFMASVVVAAEDPETFETLQSSMKLFEGSVIQVISASQTQLRTGSRKMLEIAGAADVQHRLLHTDAMAAS